MFLLSHRNDVSKQTYTLRDNKECHEVYPHALFWSRLNVGVLWNFSIHLLLSQHTEDNVGKVVTCARWMEDDSKMSTMISKMLRRALTHIAVDGSPLHHFSEASTLFNSCFLKFWECYFSSVTMWSIFSFSSMHGIRLLTCKIVDYHSRLTTFCAFQIVLAILHQANELA